MYASTGDYRHHGEAMLALGLLPSLNKTVAATALAMWDPSDITSLFTTHTGETQVSADGNTVGLLLDARPAYSAGFATVGEWIAALPSDRTGGTPSSVGTPPAPATYNPATGVGTVARTDASNASRVSFSGLTNTTLYRVDVENSGPDTLFVRANDTPVATLASGTRRVVFLSPSSGIIRFDLGANPSATTFTIHNFQALTGCIARAQATGSKRPFYKVNGGLKSLLYDGLDDCLPTVGTVDLTATDALTFVTGLQNLSNAAAAIYAETGTARSSITGGFSVIVPDSVAGAWAWFNKGTSDASVTSSNYTAPKSGVVTGIADISSDVCRLRINGVQVGTSATDQGTGNYGNHIWNFGSRNNGASAPFSGHEYGTIPHVGIADADTLANYEQWANQRTAAY